MHLEQAAGEFVLPPAGGKLLFVTAGSGITPVIGMLRNLFPVADAGVVRLPRSEPSTSPSCTSRRASPTRSSLATCASSSAAGLIRLVERYDDVHGLLDVDELDDLVPDLHERTTFACGPAGLLDALAAHHAALG